MKNSEIMIANGPRYAAPLFAADAGLVLVADGMDAIFLDFRF
jgi:hypothetical protein